MTRPKSVRCLRVDDLVIGTPRYLAAEVLESVSGSGRRTAVAHRPPTSRHRSTNCTRRASPICSAELLSERHQLQVGLREVAADAEQRQAGEACQR